MKGIRILAALLLAASTSAFCQCGLPELRDSWVKNWNEKNLDGVIKLYAPDATMLPSDGQRIAGRENIRAFLKTVMDSGVIEGPVRSVATDCSHDTGYESGTFEETIGSDGKKRQGNYLVVVRKISGKWLIVQHASTESRSKDNGVVRSTGNESAADNSALGLAQTGAQGRSGGREINFGASGRQRGAVEILSDTQGVDFGPYIQHVVGDVKSHWYGLAAEFPGPVQMKRGKLAIEFAITSDGKLAGMKLVATSGDVALDRAAWGGIVDCNPFPPLPSDFHGPYLALRFHFYYNPAKGELN